MKPKKKRNLARRINRQLLPRPAPGDLGIVQAFLNTENLQAGTDELATPSDLSAWLSSHGLLAPDAKVTSKHLQRALDIREGLHAIVAAHNGAALDAAAVERLNAACKGGRIEVQFDPEGEPRFEAATPKLADALGRLLGMVAEARIRGEWVRLKACAAGECRAAFYDLSLRCRWCSHRCGDRVRARARQHRGK